MRSTRNRGRTPLSFLAFLFSALLSPALLSSAAQAQMPAAQPAGIIDFADGDATVENAGTARLAREGDSVKVGETVTTFPKAEVHLKMADGAYLSLRENTKITITKYAANGDDADQSLIDLARGAMRSVTGWIGKYRRAGYQVRTPMVTIGVRGTDHETTHLLEGDPRGEPGTYDKVNEGATFMQSPKGTVEVQPNRAAHFHTRFTTPPRVLNEVPRFFQPARNEARFAQRSQASVRTLEDRRNELRQRRGLPPQKPPAAQRPARAQKAAADNGPPSRAAQMQQKQSRQFQERAREHNRPSPAARLQEKKQEIRHAPPERHFERKRPERREDRKK